MGHAFKRKLTGSQKALIRGPFPLDSLAYSAQCNCLHGDLTEQRYEANTTLGLDGTNDGRLHSGEYWDIKSRTLQFPPILSGRTGKNPILV